MPRPISQEHIEAHVSQTVCATSPCLAVCSPSLGPKPSEPWPTSSRKPHWWVAWQQCLQLSQDCLGEEKSSTHGRRRTMVFLGGVALLVAVVCSTVGFMYIKGHQAGHETRPDCVATRL